MKDNTALVKMRGNGNDSNTCHNSKLERIVMAVMIIIIIRALATSQMAWLPGPSQGSAHEPRGAVASQKEVGDVRSLNPKPLKPEPLKPIHGLQGSCSVSPNPKTLC